MVPNGSCGVGERSRFVVAVLPITPKGKDYLKLQRLIKRLEIFDCFVKTWIKFSYLEPLRIKKTLQSS